MHAIVLSYNIVSHLSLRYVLRLAAPGSQFGHLWYNVCSWVLFVLVGLDGGRTICLYTWGENCFKSDDQL